MALQKNIDTQYGITLSYWKVVRFNIDWHNKEGEVTIAGWLNHDVRQNGAEALGYKHFQFFKNNWPFTLDGNNITELYERLKMPIYEPGDTNNIDINPFTGAYDIFESNQPIERK
jgi:hypothetical protein